MRLVDLGLGTAVAAALCYTIQGGFNVSDAVHEAVWLDVLACLALQGVLVAGQGSTRGRVVSALAYALISLGACAVAIVIAPDGNPIADVPQNLFVATALFAVVNVVVFALSRRHVTCLALFGLGAFVCGLTQFLYTTNMLVATVAFVVSAAMMIAFRSYAETVEMASVANLPLLGKASVVGSLLPLAACVLAAAVVIGLIMPLDPPHATIKLFNEYLAYEEDQVKTSVVLDEGAERSLTSSEVDESLEPRTTTDLKVDETAPPQTSPDDTQHDDAKDYLSGEYSDFDLSGLVENMRSLAFDTPFPWWALVLGVVALLALLCIVARYAVHRARLGHIAKKPPREQVELLYRFFLSRFEKLGLGKPPSLSPVEYANLFRGELAPFVGAQGAGTFDHLTALLVYGQYADTDPSSEDLQCMYWMYREFYRRCRRELGLFKYGFRHLTL